MRVTWLRLVGVALLLAAARPAEADTWRPLEAWRIEDGQVAPWAQPGTQVDARYRGQSVRFQTTRLVAPHPLACTGATYEWRFVGAEDLFEGNLPAPAADAARRLGLGSAPIATLRVGCTNAGFDFHRTGDGTLLLGLDNVVWTLRAVRPAATPQEVVQELLVTHFTHDMGFTRESVAGKRAFLSAALLARIASYMAVTQPPDEASDINGDPFTDSQEYPDRFTLGATRAGRQRTTVTVQFADAHMRRRVDYVLVREGARWVVDDLVDARGDSLLELLAAAAKTPPPR